MSDVTRIERRVTNVPGTIVLSVLAIGVLIVGVHIIDCVQAGNCVGS